MIFASGGASGHDLRRRSGSWYFIINEVCAMIGKVKAFHPALLIITALTCFGCGPYLQKPTPLGAPGTQAQPIQNEYRIAVGDRLEVKFYYNTELNQEVAVRPDGRISLQLVKEVPAAGLTPEQLREDLLERYKKHLADPEIAVIVNSFSGHKVYVGGEVGAPGVRELIGPTTAFQAIMASGGMKDTARTKEIVVYRRGPDHNSPMAIPLNIENAMKGLDFSQDIYLQPYDIVFVPRSSVANFNVWVDQYLRKGILVLPSEFMLYYGVLTK
jgi:protein involved in polysaccharide export with SLBB domain